MTTKLETLTLHQNIDLCFAYSRDNEKFNEEQREGWLIQGENLRARLVELLGAEFPSGLDPNVQAANKKLKGINQQLQDTQNLLGKYNQIIKELQALVEILGGACSKCST